MRLEGTEAELYQRLAAMVPDIPQVPAGVRAEMLPYQLLALYGLAAPCDREGARILEIGTGQGASAIVLSQAAPRAAITSLTISRAEAEIARSNLSRAGCRNVEVLVESSVDVARRMRGVRFDLVFVDGDHNRIGLDMPWFNRLRVGGLLLCHDYSPRESKRASPVVYETLNRFAERLARPLDVMIMDASRTGMAGLYRRKGETWG